MQQPSAGRVATFSRSRQPVMRIDQADPDRLVITLPRQVSYLSLIGYILAVPMVPALLLIRHPYYLRHASSSPRMAWMLAAGWTAAFLFWLFSTARTLTFDRSLGTLSIATLWRWGRRERVVPLEQLTGVKLRRIAATYSEVLLLRAEGLAIGARRFGRSDDAARLAGEIERFLHPDPPKARRRTVRGKPGRSGALR